MKEVILIRFGEIFLKGRNYSYFENTLFKNVERRLKKFNLKLERISGRFLVSDFEAEDKDDIIEAIQTVFGLVSLSVAYEVETSVDTIKSACEKIKIKDKDSSVRNLFHGLSRGKNKLALVILQNETLFDSILELL